MENLLDSGSPPSGLATSGLGEYGRFNMLLCGCFLPASSTHFPDSSSSLWSVEVELVFDTVTAVKGYVKLALADLATQQTFQASLPPGQSNNTFILHVNKVGGGFFMRGEGSWCVHKMKNSQCLLSLTHCSCLAFSESS